MKIGLRKVCIHKSIKARTTSRLKRFVKKLFIPFYAKKGIGWFHPKKKLYNKVYQKTTFSIWDFFKKLFAKG